MHEDLSLIPAWMGKGGYGTRSYTPSAGEAEAGGALRLADQIAQPK